MSDNKWTGSKNTSGSFAVGPYTQDGSYVYMLTCTSSTGGVLSQTATVTVGKPTSTIGVNLTSNSSTAKPGETISLSWTTSGNPTSCTASSNPALADWTGNRPTTAPTAGSWVTLPSAGSYVFTLSCSGPGGTASSSTPVTVGATEKSAKPLLVISANPSSIAQGGSSLIQWETANVASCTASSNGTADGWDGSSRPVNDFNSSSAPATFTTSNSLSPNTYSYSLSCVGAPGAGSVTQSAQLVVTGGNGSGSASVVPTLTFTVSDSTASTGNNSTTVKVGSVAYLSWVSTNATNCVATGGMWAASSQPTSYNNLQQGPFTSPGIYDFALSCSNPNGNSVAQVVQVTVTSNGPGVSFTAQPNPGTQGTPATLVWTTSSDATSCTAVSGPTQDTTWTGTQPTSGSHVIPASVYNSPGTYEYVLSCTGPSGTTTVPVSFTVNPSNNTTAPQFTSDLTASPTSLPTSGGSTTLTWATSNASACTASSNPAVSGWSGSQPTSSASGGVSVTLPANTGAMPVSYTLQLSCSNGSGGTSTQTQVVTVQGTASLPMVTLSASPLTLVAGPNATTTLTYTTSNSTSCTTTSGNATGVWATQPTPNPGSNPATGSALSTPMTVAGSYTYTLSCTGPSGTTSATPVTVVVTSPAPSFTPVHGQSTSTAGLFVSTTTGSSATLATQVTPGGNLYYSWATNDATSCVPSSNEPGVSSWATTTTATSGNEVLATASNVPGYYTYTITCSGPTDPPTVSTVSVLVMSPTASFCPSTPTAAGAPIASMALLVDANAPSYAASTPSATGSSVCVGCSVGAGANVLGNVTNNPAVPAGTTFPYGFTDYASMILPVGVLTANADELNVNHSSPAPVVYPAGRTVNIGLVAPDSLIAASVLGNVSISTTLNGVAQDVIPPGALTLQLLGIVGSGSAGYATLPATRPFDGVRVNFGGTVTALSTLQVHMACVSLQ